MPGWVRRERRNDLACCAQNGGSRSAYQSAGLCAFKRVLSVVGGIIAISMARSLRCAIGSAFSRSRCRAKAEPSSRCESSKEGNACFAKRRRATNAASKIRCYRSRRAPASLPRSFSFSYVLLQVLVVCALAKHLIELCGHILDLAEC